MKITTAIRLMLSCVLLYFVWEETGWATITVLSLMTVGMEMQTKAIAK